MEKQSKPEKTNDKTGALTVRNESEEATSSKEKEIVQIDAPDPDEDISQAVELLITIIEDQGENVLIFIKGHSCPLSQEMLKVFHVLCGKDLVEVIDVGAMNNVINDFADAVEGFTGSVLPLVFFKKSFVGNYSDIRCACRFKRLDLLLEPPQCPYYHLVIIGGGHGAQSVITEILEFGGTNLKIALIETTPSLPNHLEGKYKGRIPRRLAWKAIRKLKGAGYDPSEFFNTVAFDNIERQENFSMKILCEAANITYYRGTIQFLSSDAINVTEYSGEPGSNSYDEYCCEARSTNMVGMAYIICSGCQPLIPEFRGSEFCMPLESFLLLGKIPKSALIIGNSPEVLETAHLISVAGGEVTVVTGSKIWLPEYDPWFVEEILHSFDDFRVTFLKISKILRIIIVKEKYKALLRIRNGRLYYTGLFEKVIIDYKTVPMSNYMDLEQADIKIDKRSRKIKVNDAYRSTNGFVYAFGSIARGHPSNPKFEIFAGRRLINMILNGVDNVHVPKIYPFIIMTPLEYIFCGETKKSAILKYKKYNRDIVINVSQNCRFHIKVISTRSRQHKSYNTESDEVVGIHILGFDICNLISGLDLMLERGATKGELVTKFFQSPIFKELKLQRISFTSKKIRCNAPNTSELQDKNSDKEPDTRTLSTETWRFSSAEHSVKGGFTNTENLYKGLTLPTSIQNKYVKGGFTNTENLYKGLTLPTRIQNKWNEDYEIMSIICLMCPIILSRVLTYPNKLIFENKDSNYSASVSETESDVNDETDTSSLASVKKYPIPETGEYPSRPLTRHNDAQNSSSKSGDNQQYFDKVRRNNISSRHGRNGHSRKRQFISEPGGGDAILNRQGEDGSKTHDHPQNLCNYSREEFQQPSISKTKCHTGNNSDSDSSEDHRIDRDNRLRLNTSTASSPIDLSSTSSLITEGSGSESPTRCMESHGSISSTKENGTDSFDGTDSERNICRLNPPSIDILVPSTSGLRPVSSSSESSRKIPLSHSKARKVYKTSKSHRVSCSIYSSQTDGVLNERPKTRRRIIKFSSSESGTEITDPVEKKCLDSSALNNNNDGTPNNIPDHN